MLVFSNIPYILCSIVGRLIFYKKNCTLSVLIDLGNAMNIDIVLISLNQPKINLYSYTSTFHYRKLGLVL